MAVSTLFSTAAPAAANVAGAGSSAAAPVYRAWADVYAGEHATSLNYDSVGSTEGLKRIRAGAVDFGASDVAPAEADLSRDGLVLVPMFVTGAVPVVNLPHVASNQLKLDGPTLAQIFLGNIKRWDAPEIKALNPGMVLPALPIRPIVRSDGSGTTYYFTDFLSHVSPAWKQRFGTNTKIEWAESCVPAKGSEGVASAVRDTAGAIGYIDFNYVGDRNLVATRVANADGQFVEARPEGFREALRHSDWFDGDFHASLADRPGSGSWPITMGTFVLLRKVSAEPQKAGEALRFFAWALLSGDELVDRLKFVRLPDKIQSIAFKNLSTVVDAEGHPIGLQILSGALVSGVKTHGG